MTNEYLFNAGASAQLVPEADTARHAVAALRGYAYQILVTTLAWVDIDENSRLFLEVAEDYAVIADQALSAVQIKDTAASGPITLNTPSVHKAVDSFIDLVERNPDREIELRFFTTSEIGKEKAIADRPEGIAGLIYWKKAASGADISPLRTFLQSDKLSCSVRTFANSRDDESLRRDLIGRIRWDCGRPDITNIRMELEQRMIVLGRDRFHLPTYEARRIVELLAFRVLRKCTTTDISARVLTRAELYSIIDSASQSTVPRTTVELLSRLASQAMAPAGEGTALLYPQIATEPGWFLSGATLPVPTNLLDRKETKSRVWDALDEFGVSVLVGGSGTGKSTLSRSTARARDKEFFLVDLRNTEPLETRDRLDWVFARLAGLPLSMLILEDFNCLEDKQAGLSLARVFEAARRHGHEILISCYRAPSAVTLMEVGLTQECVLECPYFSQEETCRLVQVYGGDPGIWGNIAHLAGGSGHPQLVHAFVLGKAASGWPAQNRKELLNNVFSSKDVDAARYAARQSLVSGLPDDTRQLLYRLSLVVGRLSRSLALTIGNVAPSLSKVGECMDQLVGPWIEILGEDLCRVSPLVANFGRENLPLDEQQRIHAAIATEMLERRTVDASDIDAILLHALLGKSVRSLVLAAHCVLTADHDDLERYADYLPIFRLLGTDRPIFPEDFSVSTILRIAQFRLISTGKERERIPDVVDLLFEEIEKIQEINVRSATEYMAIATVLVTMGIANYLDNWLDLLLKIWSMSHEDETLKAFFLASGTNVFCEVESDVPSKLFHIGSSNIKTVARLEYIINEMDRLTPCDRSILFPHTEEESSICAGFVSSPWLSQQRRSDLDAKDAAIRYGRMAEKTREWGFKLLSMHCTATQAVMLDEYLGNGDAAVAAVRGAIRVHGRHPVLAHALAKIYWRAKDYDFTLAILRDVAKEVGEGNPVDGAYALRIAAISAAKCGDWAQAEQWFLDARNCANQVHVNDMSVMAIGLAADAAVAAHHVGDLNRALAGLVITVEALAQIPPDTTLRAAYCHRVVRHSILWLKSQITEDKIKIEDHILYMEPGACSNPEPSNAIRKLPLAHIDIAWYLLAEIDIRSGMGSDIASSIHDRLSDGPIPMMDSLLRVYMLQVDIDRSDVVQFVEHFVMYLEATKYMSMNFDQLKTDVGPDAKSLDFERGSLPAFCFERPIDSVLERAARHAILTYAVCSVFSEQSAQLSELDAALRKKFTSEFPGESIFEYWDGNSVETSVLEKTVIDLVKNKTQSEFIEPLDLWMMGIRFFEFSTDTIFRDFLVSRIASWQRVGWRRILTKETFRLLTPRQTVPLIEEALGIPENNAHFLAKILLATSEAVGSSLGTKYRAHLREIAEQTETA